MPHRPVSYGRKATLVGAQALAISLVAGILIGSDGALPPYWGLSAFLFAFGFGVFAGAVAETGALFRTWGAFYSLDNSRLWMPIGLAAFGWFLAWATHGDPAHYILSAVVFAAGYFLIEVGFGVARGFGSVPPGRGAADRPEPPQAGAD